MYRAITLKNKRWLLEHFFGRQQNLCVLESREVFVKEDGPHHSLPVFSPATSSAGRSCEVS